VTTVAAGALVDQAFADRRLFKMALSRLPGGLAAARSRYAGDVSPPLVLVEAAAGVDAGTLLAEIDALADTCAAGTNLILLGEINDVTLYRNLLRRGVADYLVMPVGPMRLIEAVQDLYRDAARRPAGQVIAFIGARGGCGSTTLACNVGHRLAHETPADVVVMDLDLPFGGADLAFNLETTNGIQAVLSDPERIDEGFLQRFPGKLGERLHLLAAPASLESDAAVSGVALEACLAGLRQQAGTVILDLPRVWSEWLRQTLTTVDQVVVTATPDLVSVRNTRNLLDLLVARRALDQPPILVLNRVGAARRGEVTVRDFAAAVRLAPALTIAEDSQVFGLAASLGKMIQDVNRGSKAALAIRELAARFVSVPPARPGSRPGSWPGPAWLQRLIGKG
jgi:pilus assembly protein CpaE